MKTGFTTSAMTESKAYRSDLANKGDAEGVGSLRWFGNVLCRWVQNRHTSAITVGDVVYHDFSTDGANFVGIVYDCATGLEGFMAGVVASTSIAADTDGSTDDGGYGWIIIEGYAAAVSMLDAANDIAIGDSLKSGDGLLSVAQDQGIGTAPIYKRTIMALEALASSTGAADKKGYVHCF